MRLAMPLFYHHPRIFRITLFCHVGMAPCRSAVGNREIMDEVRMYVIRRPHGVIPEFLAPMPKMTEEGLSSVARGVASGCVQLELG